MKNFKFNIHPLFWALGILLTLLGEGYLFLVYIFTAIIHEFAHSVTASYYNCRTEQITLYPYGAVLYGEFSDLKPTQEIIVALSGPLFNIITAVLFTALWWIFPEIYAYTDVIVMVNVSIALFNLLPVYPLDGGRILMCFLKLKIGTRKACAAVKIMGLICCIVFAALYFISLFYEINYSFALVSVFLLTSILEDSGGKESVQSVIYPPSGKKLLCGVEKKYIQVSGEITLLEAIRLFNTQYYYILEVLDKNGNAVKIIEHKDLENILSDYSPHTKLIYIK